ncbi:hypothetical protein NM208_g4551 [Fusarium decemcellulare]|uniref:Uncharacterized protein n=1 Tax=Fusarium decemcellulare TaxID=57161 RepID=A0ACC1SKD7_9HYPO|nr:hypothetical protein NM208_g4551 [Fusarium decemcellulare]
MEIWPLTLIRWSIREEREPRTDNSTEELLFPREPAWPHHLLDSPSAHSTDPTPVVQTPSFHSRDSGSVSASSRPDQPPFIPASFVTNSQDTRGLSLGAALDPDRLGEGEPSSHLDMLSQCDQGTAGMPRNDDPIDMRLVSQPAAQYLYEGFFKHFNCLMGLLDPQLYTFSYTRERSSLLFTMILTISSRIFQPESHQAIRDQAELLLGRALLACESAIENIWAIICMYHWKDANDARGYTLIGFALRMAASAEWNMTRRSVSYDTEDLRGSTELQVRQKRDKDRIWLALGNIDRTLSYFTDRPLSIIAPNEQVASRRWLTLTEWTYPLGDAKALGGHELTGIARIVYDSTMKTRNDSTSSPSQSTVDFEAFEKDMEEFNKKITEWGTYWRTAFSRFPNLEPFQTPLTYLFQEYMRLYFNSALLHRMLVSESRPSLNRKVAHTTRVCYSSALGVLQQTVAMGEMDIIYYLWDTAHLMIAYASIMIPELLRQADDESVISKNEVLDILTQVTTIYVVTARSMGSPTLRPYELRLGRVMTTNAVLIQARLLSAILARLRADIVDAENGLTTQSTATISPGPGLSWIEHQLNQAMFFDGRIESHQSDSINLASPTVGQAHDISSLTSEMHDDLDVMLDDDFVNSRYLDVGLSSEDEPGIFSHSH